MTTQPLVLITGGAGFIGSHTADALIAAGYRVRVLDSLLPQVHGESGAFPAYLHPAVESVLGDVRDAGAVRRALEGVSFVFHFAALTGVGQGGHEMRAYVDTNVVGVSTVLECIARDGLPVRRLVLASSRAVYGEGDHVCAVHGRLHPAGRSEADLAAGEFDLLCPICRQPMAPAPTPEDRPLQPLSIYGWTKKLQEEHCAFAAAQFGLKVVCLRYFNVYGERQSLRNAYTGVIPAFVERLLAEQPIPLYEHGRPLRDFVHVSDVVQANLRAIEADLPDLVAINVGSGRDSSILDIAHAVASALGLRPSFVDRAEYRVGDVFACTADLDRARRLLDYRPQMSLQAGMARLVGWAAGEERPQNLDVAAAELRRFGMLRQGASGGDRG